ncbi:MAG: DUF1302 family protein [Zavarzinia sp.]
MAGASLVVCTLLAGQANADDTWKITDIGVHGYLRQYISMNLQDVPETSEDDAYDLSMVRTQLRLDPRLVFGPLRFFGQLRAVKEIETNYLRRLERLGNTSDGSQDEILGNYDGVEIRELYGEFDLGERVTMRLGKQQIVWGESDFFAANDQVHGFDYRWRSFLEPENEELRKALIIANAMVQVPELDGSLQLYVRPGIDRDEDIGTTYDLFGGRWANQPNKGLDFFGTSGGVPLVRYNYDQSGAEQREPTFGARWQGLAGDVSYSFMFLRSHNQDPVLNPSALLSSNGYKGELSTAVLGDLIYPIVNTLGGTARAHDRGRRRRNHPRRRAAPGPAPGPSVQVGQLLDLRRPRRLGRSRDGEVDRNVPDPGRGRRRGAAALPGAPADRGGDRDGLSDQPAVRGRGAAVPGQGSGIRAGRP